MLSERAEIFFLLLGIEAYGKCNVTFEQAFHTTRPAYFKEDVHKTWFRNKPSTEQMACMVVSSEHSIEENAYFVIFQGGLKKSQLTF